jgi:enolase
MKIKHLSSITIYDSRGKPTIRTKVVLEDGSFGISSVPSGASTGKYEALEMRDNDKNRFFGLTVDCAVENVNQKLAKELVGVDFKTPADLDKRLIELDGTENKSNLGANAILSVSQAYLKALAFSQKKPLWQIINENYFPNTSPSFPRLMVNVVNGGKHANFNFDIQEFMIVPKTNIPSESVYMAAFIFSALGKKLKKMGLSTLVGDEGGYSPKLLGNETVIKILTEVGTDIGLKAGADYHLALDSAASEFFDEKEKKYKLQSEKKTLISDELIDYYLALEKKYPLISFEDPFCEDDWESFSKLTAKTKLMVVGDDLYVTNTKRIKIGIEKKATNAILIKPNQIGTVYETVEAIKMAKKVGWKIVISHRSGETEDAFIADLAYASCADFIKTGSMCRSERLAKYNRLIEIEKWE